MAGQTRSIAFTVSSLAPGSADLDASIIYKTVNSEGQLSTLAVSQNLVQKGLHDPHKITYLHPSGIVSYSILRAPAANTSSKSQEMVSAPVLLHLHGAGIEADSDLITHAFDPVSDLCAWVVIPSGVTSWSGDDWREYRTCTDTNRQLTSV